MSDSLSSLYGGRGIAITHGRGSRVFDTSGREYLDFFNGHGASLFGHSHPLLTEALEKASKGIWTSGAGFGSPVREKLADELGQMLGEGRVFLCNSGTEAIEAALNPAPGNWLYFVSDQGFTEFSDTFAQQKAAEEKYRASKGQ